MLLQDLGLLAKPVNSANPLFYDHWVPWEVVVNEEGAELEVEALAHPVLAVSDKNFDGNKCFVRRLRDDLKVRVCPRGNLSASHAVAARVQLALAGTIAQHRLGKTPGKRAFANPGGPHKQKRACQSPKLQALAKLKRADGHVLSARAGVATGVVVAAQRSEVLIGRSATL